MRLIWKGGFNGDEAMLPTRAHLPNSVPFEELDAKRFALVMNIAAVLIFAAAFVLLKLRGMEGASLWGFLAALVALVPHELLHAICFKGDVYVYSWLKRGTIFVIGTETMSRGRFVFLSLLPNIVFGLIPYAAALICPQLVFLGCLGSLSLGCGAGDYYNAFNALTQVPKGARVYLDGFHSYWYRPQPREGLEHAQHR